MNKKLQAKDLVIDFLNTTFLLALIGFCVFYFIVKDYFFTAAVVARAVFATAIMGIVFLIKFKQEQVKVRHFKKYESLDEVAVYFSRYDHYLSLIFNVAAVLSIVVLALIDGRIDQLTIVYVILNSLILSLWQLVIFRKKGESAQKYYATNAEKINDQLVIYLNPVLMMGLTIVGEGVNLLRVLQIFTIFILMFMRHQIIFKAKK